MSHKEWGTAHDLAVIMDQTEIAEVFHNFTKAAGSKVMDWQFQTAEATPSQIGVENAASPAYRGAIRHGR
jgi:hypothetical protein